MVFEAEASGGSKADGLPHLSLSLPLSIPPKFSDKPMGGKVRSSEGEVPRLPYKYHPVDNFGKIRPIFIIFFSLLNPERSMEEA